MLLKYSRILNLPVLCADSGKKAGIVKDILLSPDERKVEALLLETKGILPGRRMVFLKDLVIIGEEALLIRGGGSLYDMKKTMGRGSIKNKSGLIGLRVYSQTGGELGIVKDVLFDSSTGKVEVFELSDGIFQDVMSGRKRLPLFGTVEMGEEYAVVGREAVEEMDHTGGGIKNMLPG